MHFAFFDTSTSICYVHNKQLPVRAEARFDFDFLTVRKLKGIFCQVYQDLLKTNLVANNFFWQLVRYHFWHGKIIYIFSRQRQALNYLKTEGCRLHFSMLPKDVNDKFERLERIELLQSCYKAILLNHLQIQDVVHQTQQKVYLRNNQKDDLACRIKYHTIQKRFEKHECRRKR